MVRKKWMRTVGTALSWAGLTLVPPGMLPGAAATPPVREQLVTVQEPGRAPQKARILHSWRAEGAKCYLVQAVDTGEWITVVETAAPFTGAGQTVAIKVYRWGKNQTSPPGAPPVRAAEETPVVKPASTPFVPSPPPASTPFVPSPPPQVPVMPAAVHVDAPATSGAVVVHTSRVQVLVPATAMTSVAQPAPAPVLAPAPAMTAVAPPAPAPVLPPAAAVTTITPPPRVPVHAPATAGTAVAQPSGSKASPYGATTAVLVAQQPIKTDDTVKDPRVSPYGMSGEPTTIAEDRQTKRPSSVAGATPYGGGPASAPPVVAKPSVPAASTSKPASPYGGTGGPASTPPVVAKPSVEATATGKLASPYGGTGGPASAPPVVAKPSEGTPASKTASPYGGIGGPVIIAERQVKPPAPKMGSPYGGGAVADATMTLPEPEPVASAPVHQKPEIATPVLPASPGNKPPVVIKTTERIVVVKSTPAPTFPPLPSRSEDDSGTASPSFETKQPTPPPPNPNHTLVGVIGQWSANRAIQGSAAKTVTSQAKAVKVEPATASNWRDSWGKPATPAATKIEDDPLTNPRAYSKLAQAVLPRETAGDSTAKAGKSGGHAEKLPVGMKSAVQAFGVPDDTLAPDGQPLPLPPNATAANVANAFTDVPVPAPAKPMNAFLAPPARPVNPMMSQPNPTAVAAAQMPSYPVMSQPIPMPTSRPVMPANYQVGEQAGLPKVDPRLLAMDDQAVHQALATLREAMLPSHREYAADTLGRTDWRKHPAVVDALIKAAQEDPASSVRVACLRSLARMKAATTPVYDALHSLRNDKEDVVRQEAHKAATALGMPADAPGLLPVNGLDLPR